MASPTPTRSVLDLARIRPDRTRPESFRPLFILVAAGLYVALVWFALPTLGVPAKLVMTAFGLAAIGWSATDLNSTYIALAAAITCSLALMESGTQVGLTALADDTILLIVGAFVMAAAINATGISQKLIESVVTIAPTLTSLCFLLTGLILALSFVIPSTSGRAALLVPTFLALRHQLAHPGAVRAIAVLIPVTIVLSSSATLVSSGGNLVAAETVARLTGQTITYAGWLLVHLPLATISCFLTSWVVLRVFVDRQSRSMDLRDLLTGQTPGDEIGERCSQRSIAFVISVMALVLAGWVSQGWHGVPAGMIALIGALVVTLPGIGPVGFKSAVNGIDWSLILFLAASLQIGVAVIDSGLADWAANSILSAATGSTLPPGATIILITLIGLFAHFVITSRTARTAAFLPPILLVALSFGLQPVAVTHLMAAALGYCLTLVVGSKALVIFSELGGINFSQRDLFRLAVYLLPLHFFLLMGFALIVWPALGVSIIESSPAASIIMPLPTY